MNIGTLVCEVVSVPEKQDHLLVVHFREDLKAHDGYEKLKALIETLEGVEKVNSINRYSVSVWRAWCFTPEEVSESVALVVAATLGLDVFGGRDCERKSE